MTMRRASSLVIAAAFAASCAGLTTPAPAGGTTTPKPPPAVAPVPDSIKWVQNSAEYVALVTQAYRVATVKIEAEARQRPAGTWAVILDADETVLSNISYQAGLARDGVTLTTVFPLLIDTPLLDRPELPPILRQGRRIPASAVVHKVLRAVARRRARVYIPGTVRLIAALHGIAPSLLDRYGTWFGFERAR